MKTEQRLNIVYQNALEIPFNNKSKFIIFSDTHRGDGSLSDEFTRNQNIFNFALNYYYEHEFTLIEAGDGDELWEHKNYSVVINAHLESFNMLQRFHDDNRYYRIYGNHDIYLKDHNKHYFSTLVPTMPLTFHHIREHNTIKIGNQH